MAKQAADSGTLKSTANRLRSDDTAICMVNGKSHGLSKKVLQFPTFFAYCRKTDGRQPILS